MTARITWNGNNIDFILDDDGTIQNTMKKDNVNEAMSGAVETVTLFKRGQINCGGFFSEDDYIYLWLAWWQWASSGKTFSFASDSSNTASTTLDGAAASGQKVIPLTSTSGLAVGDNCFVKAADNLYEAEGIKIASISAGVSVTAESNLLNSYASGDTFKHYGYWPSVRTTIKNFTPRRTGIEESDSDYYYRYNFSFEELI
jgi:hypothetical protein